MGTVGVLAAVASLALTVGSPAAGAAQDIDGPFDYGTISTGDAPFATAGNTAGRVVGSGDLEGKDHAYEFFADSPPQLLGEPSGYSASAAWDINGAGLVVGSMSDGTGVDAGIWVPGQAPALLPPVSDMEATWAFAINDSNVVVGFGKGAGADELHAIRWDGPSGTTLDDLGAEAAVALDVNNAGIAVGYVGGFDDDDPFSPVLWEPGEPAVTLPTLGGTMAMASGINDAGEVIGLSTTAGDAEIHLVRWTSDGLEDLGVPAGAQLVMFPENPRLIGPKINGNGHGSLVALVGGDEPLPVGYVWSDADGFTRLPAFPGAQQIAYSLNIDNAGRIVGVAISASNEPVATVWQIVQPDPPAPPGPPAPSPDPGPAGGDGAGSSPAGGTGSGTGNTGAAAPTLPATGSRALPTLGFLAVVLTVAGSAMTLGGRLTVSRVRRR